MTDLSSHQDALLEGCRQAALAAASDEPGWMSELRERSTEHLAEHGLPRPKQEPWRYTPLTRLSEAPFERLPEGASGVVDAAALAPHLLGDEASHRLVFVDGRHSPEHSELGELPAGVRLTSLASALHENAEAIGEYLGRIADPTEHAFSALSAALTLDGAYLHLAAGAKLEKPVHLLFYSSSTASPALLSTRVLVVAEAGAQATIVETWAGAADATYMANATTELSLGEAAELCLVKSQREAPGAYHLASLAARQAARSRLVVHTANFGGGLVRNQIHVSLDGEKAAVELFGLSASSGNQHVENHTLIDHRVPSCTSGEVYRAVLDDRSTGVFRGQVLVRQDAQHTDSNQQSKNLLLSRDAQMNTKPELEIYADDVKCSHGATIGQLDSEQLFYLRSRGISERDARRLLIQAFSRDLLNRIPVEPLRDDLKELFSERFA